MGCYFFQSTYHVSLPQAILYYILLLQNSFKIVLNYNEGSISKSLLLPEISTQCVETFAMIEYNTAPIIVHIYS